MWIVSCTVLLDSLPHYCHFVLHLIVHLFQEVYSTSIEGFGRNMIPCIGWPVYHVFLKVFFFIYNDHAVSYTHLDVYKRQFNDCLSTDVGPKPSCPISTPGTSLWLICQATDLPHPLHGFLFQPFFVLFLYWILLFQFYVFSFTLRLENDQAVRGADSGAGHIQLAVGEAVTPKIHARHF